MPVTESQENAVKTYVDRKIEWISSALDRHCNFRGKITSYLFDAKDFAEKQDYYSLFKEVNELVDDPSAADSPLIIHADDVSLMRAFAGLYSLHLPTALIADRVQIPLENCALCAIPTLDDIPDTLTIPAYLRASQSDLYYVTTRFLATTQALTNTRFELQRLVTDDHALELFDGILYVDYLRQLRPPFRQLSSDELAVPKLLGHNPRMPLLMDWYSEMSIEANTGFDLRDFPELRKLACDYYYTQLIKRRSIEALIISGLVLTGGTFIAGGMAIGFAIASAKAAATAAAIAKAAAAKAALAKTATMVSVKATTAASAKAAAVASAKATAAAANATAAVVSTEVSVAAGAGAAAAGIGILLMKSDNKGDEYKRSTRARVFTAQIEKRRRAYFPNSSPIKYAVATETIQLVSTAALCSIYGLWKNELKGGAPAQPEVLEDYLDKDFDYIPC